MIYPQSAALCQVLEQRQQSGISNRQRRQSGTGPTGPAKRIQARQRQRACALMT